MAILSEIVRFVLPPTKAKLAEFLQLRQHVSRSCSVHDQYFGYVTPVKSSALRARENEMCWVIQWPHGSRLAENADLRARLKGLTSESTGEGATSLLFQFEEAQVPELTKALEAPFCEFAIINLIPNRPGAAAPWFAESMHKTYTDCYYAAGFTGGNWSYALNTNDTYGAPARDEIDDGQRKEIIPQGERRLACYYLGWDTIEHHHEFSKTPLFFEEINKLAPYFGPGTGAWYVTFEKHSGLQQPET